MMWPCRWHQQSVRKVSVWPVSLLFVTPVLCSVGLLFLSVSLSVRNSDEFKRRKNKD